MLECVLSQPEPTYLIVEWPEVLEMAKAGVAHRNEDGHTQNHQCEQRRGSQETWNITQRVRWDVKYDKSPHVEY